MAENKLTPDIGVPEVAPTAETTPSAAVDTTAPVTTTANTTAAKPVETAVPKKKKSPLDMVKKFLAKFKKEKKTEPVTA